MVQDLFRCYRATRDLGALVREERELREALRRAYGDPDDPEADEGCQPEPETAALFREVCEELREASRRVRGPSDAERGGREAR